MCVKQLLTKETVHGRLLRIIMSSLLHHDLSHMASFTHHNTCINIIDAFIGEEAVVDGLQAEREDDLHPSNISFKPIRLDIRDHLPPDMQGR